MFTQNASLVSNLLVKAVVRQVYDLRFITRKDFISIYQHLCSKECITNLFSGEVSGNNKLGRVIWSVLNSYDDVMPTEDFAKISSVKREWLSANKDIAQEFFNLNWLGLYETIDILDKDLKSDLEKDLAKKGRVESTETIKTSTDCYGVHAYHMPCKRTYYGENIEKWLESSTGPKYYGLCTTVELINYNEVEVHETSSGCVYSKMLVGIDAAASEFDAPPEVFAPAYRYLRENGYKHFTYHAGEDFFHVLSGLRAIYEAIIFLDLKRGDRIGHASATGISIDLWRENIGEKMLIRRGEYLDDLLFAYHLIENSDNQRLINYLPSLELTINNISCDVYGGHIPLRLLIESWLYRYKNPEAEYNGTSVKSGLDLPLKYFLLYHWKETRDKYDKIIEIETFGAFGRDELVELQLMLLEYMFHHEIVIETLPTSNVVIGVHRDYTTYHLYNWLEWRKQGNFVPPIVVGTDDAGIFATNIYNEYCNIYCQFVYAKRMSTEEAIAYIEELHHNSRLYAFVTE